MSKKVKGIIVEIGGDTVGLNNALESANSKIRATENSLKDVKKLLKFDPTNTELLNQKQKLLKDTIAKTTEKLNSLKEANKGVTVDNAKYDEWTKKHSNLQGQITKTSNKLEELKKENDKLFKDKSQDFGRFEELQKEIYETEKKLNSLKEKTKQTYEEMGKPISEEGYDELQREIIRTEQFLKGLEEQASRSNITLSKISATAEKVGNKLEGIGSKLTTSVTLPVIAAGAAAYKYSSDLTEAENKTEAVFGNMSDKIKDWAKNSIDTMGMARSTAYDAVSLYGDMATSMGLTKSSAVDMSMSLVELSADLSSFKNVSLETSQNALKGIFTGETESLKNLGIVMTETQLKAYAMSKGFEKNYEDMTQAEKVALRYEYVLENSKNAIGDYARTSGEAAGQMRKLPEALKELAASFKESIEPVITPAIEALNDLIISFGKLDDGTKKFIVGAALTAAATGPVLTGIGKVSKGVSAATKAVSGLNIALKTTKGITAGSIGLGVAAVGGLISLEVKHYNDFLNDIDEKYEKIAEDAVKLHNENIDNLEKQKEAAEEKYNSELAAINKRYDEQIKSIANTQKELKKAVENEQKLYEKAHKERLSQLEKEKNAKLDIISFEEEKATAEIQAQIDALDALTEAEDKEKQAKENAEKLEELKRKISTAKTYAEKADAEREYTAEVKRQEEEKTRLAREEQKKQLQNKISQINSEADKKREKVNEEYAAAEQLENDKYTLAQEGFTKRLEALDTYIEDETEKLDELKEANIKKMQDETKAYKEELQKRIDAENKVKKQKEDKVEDDRKKEKEKYSGVKGYLKYFVSDYNVGHNASGTNDWHGGLTYVHEQGGELINLPQHTQIIPHDLSVEYMRALAAQQSATTNNYSARQLVNVFKIDGQTVAEVINPAVSVGLSNSHDTRGRALGVKK